MSRVEKTRRVKRFAVLAAHRRFVWEWRIIIVVAFQSQSIGNSVYQRKMYWRSQSHYCNTTVSSRDRYELFTMTYSVYLYGCNFWTYAVFVSCQVFVGFQFAMVVSFKWICKYMIPFMLKISICWGLTTIYSQFFPLMYGFTGIKNIG